MKGKKMIVTAIAVGWLVGDYCSQTGISKSAFENTVLTIVFSCFAILMFNLISELKNFVHDKKNDKESKVQRQQIVFHDCVKERAVEEFRQQRKEFFDSYFKQSSIQMKTTK